MSLAIRYVRSLAEVVAPAEAFLRRQSGDFFAQPQIVVPTAGAKAWLTVELARRLGAGNTGGGDGIVAHVGFVTPAAISSLLEPTGSRAPGPSDDPWEVERLTFTILDAIVADKRYLSRITQAGGPLLAARAIADRFDHNHFRRPGMILAWEEGRAELSPAADETGRTVTTLLANRDRWQFDLWRAVRERIGEPSPPARDQLATTAGSDAVFVAGLQSLSLHQIQLLERLSTVAGPGGRPCDVEIVLVHPSPALREAWVHAAPAVSLGIAPTRTDEPVASDHDHHADPLVTSWLRGTREAQWLLASQGTTPTHDDAPDTAPAAATITAPVTNAPLLARLQHAVTTGHIAPARTGTSPLDAGDHSLLIHRCHDLSRQAEVLHDAIVHAFGELDDLAPHEVVIVSPRIAELAPHLEAEFSRTVQGTPNLLGSRDGTISLPLVVADRGIHEMHPAAELLTDLLALAGSRCSVDAMLAVAAHPLVQAHFHLDENDIATWRRCITQTNIRWGLDADRRERAGLAVPELSAHSWRLGLERMLLGAVVSDGAPEPVLGDVVPLLHGEAAEVTSLSPLVSIFRIIDALDLATTESKPVAAWCDLLEGTLADLAGDASDDLEIPLHQIDALRKATISGDATVDVPVPFHDVKTLLTSRLTAAVGRQPLLTGAITATSMIPLRGVPFRVVCVAGFDDAALSSGENDSDDLATRQDLLGDTDARLEVRRSLLDSVLAARDRLVITCTGMDVKNNATLPLVTPLAELVDFAGRHGIPQLTRSGEQHSAIEVFHPRHACSRANFEAGGVLPETHWSHDTAAQAAAEALGEEPVTAVASAAPIEPPALLELDWLAEFLHNPLWPYVNKTLGITLWRDDDLEIPATLPLELEYRQKRDLGESYLERLLATDNRSGMADAWAAAVRANGDVPVLGYGGDVIDHIQQFSHALLDTAAALGTPLDESSPETVHLQLGDVTLSGPLERWFPEAHSLVLVRPDAQATSSRAFVRAKLRSVVHLLAARAAGLAVEQAIIFSERDTWSPGQTDAKGRTVDPVMKRQAILDDSIDAARARDLLAALVELYQQAALRPHGLFGDTAARLAESREAAAEVFAAQLANQGYARSHEAVVHGLTPDFDAVFPPDDPRVPFFERFSRLATSEYNRSRKAYVYAPPAHIA